MYNKMEKLTTFKVREKFAIGEYAFSVGAHLYLTDVKNVENPDSIIKIFDKNMEFVCEIKQIAFDDSFLKNLKE